MKESNPTETHFESASGLDMFSDGKSKVRYPAYIGLDVHKETIAVAVAVARAGRDAQESWGEIAKQAEGGRQAGSTLTFLSRSILVC